MTIDQRPRRQRKAPLSPAPGRGAICSVLHARSPTRCRARALGQRRRRRAPDEALWIDLLEPTAEEERAVEAQLGIDVPTREEMREIETSNRLYEEDGAVYLTSTIVTKLDTDLPQNAQVTFILKDGRLVTNRYTDPLPFRRFITYAERHPASLQLRAGGARRAARGDRQPHRRRDRARRRRSRRACRPRCSRVRARRRGARRDFRAVLEQHRPERRAHRQGAREPGEPRARCWPSCSRPRCVNLDQEVRTRLRTLSRDVIAMSDHATFLGNNVSFMLDATLGMINIDQNNILKIFSVVTVFLLPPSVIGAIYGMNFDHIPWAHESWGFMGALGLMVVSALIPYLIFKRRGWL